MASWLRSCIIAEQKRKALKLSNTGSLQLQPIQYSLTDKFDAFALEWNRNVY